MLKHLKSLELNNCPLLEKLPEDLGQLECLEKLYLIECKFLQDIPDSICNMKCLQVLHIKEALKSSKSQFTKNYCNRRTQDKTTTTWKIPKMSFIHALYHIRIQESDVKILTYVDFVDVN
ncbi:unnamed protein product [Lactuca virosa]|uniref:Uncharacterized protein n=1 Tax=Lactuca virosa TaxID=75947 RepID=A0AAU9N0K2_9ASTR|nr:unnamed protein product [Lactuca virosa]